MTNTEFEVIGVGSPIVDTLSFIPDDFLKEISGEKGGMKLVDHEYIQSLIAKLPGEKYSAPGGAAANTILNLAKLGAQTTFLGMLGQDENAVFYKDSFLAGGCDCSRFKSNSEYSTAHCLSMITPDAERTMRTYLGAASQLDPASITAKDFNGCKHLHIEGYLIFNRELLPHILKEAKNSGCSISLDLGSFEIVKGAMDILPDLIKNYVDLVFANGEEAAAYLGENNHDKALDLLAQSCDIVAIKLGKDGSIIKQGNKKYIIAPEKAEKVIDSTGAGDLWASGFLYGFVKGYPLETCGKIGSIVGCEAVQHTGASIPEESCTKIIKQIKKL
ncbi:MAG: adenosine kinase [Candidatus Rifleibacteriota bacterium]